MRDRFLVTLIFLPIAIYLVSLGGYFYMGMMILILCIAAWEFANLFRAGGFKIARGVVLGGVVTLLVARQINGDAGDPFAADSLVLSATTLVAMVVHLVRYERGGENPAINFVGTIGAVVYIGFLGGYLIPLRQLPDGFWWWMTVLPAVWLADSGAYFYGRKFGKTKLSPRLSPKKSWEGYIAGVITGTLGTGLLALLWQTLAPAEILVSPMNGAILGLVLSIVTTLGDLGQSMIKRQFNIKDSGSILPGHGGVFDRVDTWIWAAVIGYYIISLFFV